MALRTHYLALVVSVVLLGVILEAIRRRKLQERYSLVWLSVAGAMMAVGLSDRLLKSVARVVGIYYPPSALFLLGLVFVVVLLLHFSLVISQLSEQTRMLAQKVALLEARPAKRPRKGTKI